MSWSLHKHKYELEQNIQITAREMAFYNTLLKEATLRHEKLCQSNQELSTANHEVDNIRKQAQMSRLESIREQCLKRSCDPFVSSVVAQLVRDESSNGIDISIQDTSTFVDIVLRVQSIAEARLVFEVFGIPDEETESIKRWSFQNGLDKVDNEDYQKISKEMFEDSFETELK